jgi:hypothetical protein
VGGGGRDPLSGSRRLTRQTTAPGLPGWPSRGRSSSTCVHLHRGRSRPGAAANGLPGRVPLRSMPAVAGRKACTGEGLAVVRCALPSDGGRRPSRSVSVLRLTSPAHRSLCSCHMADEPPVPQPKESEADHPACALREHSVTLGHLPVTVQRTNVPVSARCPTLAAGAARPSGPRCVAAGGTSRRDGMHRVSRPGDHVARPGPRPAGAVER